MSTTAKDVLAWVVVAVWSAFGWSSVAQAGCGCDKPPPPPAAVRPSFASPGAEVTLFSDALRVGETYKVYFSGMGGVSRAYGKAVMRRDLADGARKAQLVVRAPTLPPGPTHISVPDVGLKVLDHQFTMLPRALSLPQATGETRAECYSAAVGADGTVYIPVDVGAIAARMLFNGVAYEYPLTFGAANVAIYNTQGFLMQLLGPREAGIYDISDPGTPDSFELTYDRHEFETYRRDHARDESLQRDSSDPEWHASGTPHIDHDHLVIALQGTLEDGRMPAPGATPPFDLSIVTHLPGSSASPVSNVTRWGDCAAERNDDEDDDDRWRADDEDDDDRWRADDEDDDHDGWRDDDDRHRSGHPGWSWRR